MSMVPPKRSRFSRALVGVTMVGRYVHTKNLIVLMYGGDDSYDLDV